MDIKGIKTFGELKQAAYGYKSIKDELRTNLINKIKNNETVFEGIYGYENTVIPQLEHAILSKHNIIFLGLRGQAKSRLARLMVNLLDEYIPYITGSEVNDDPFYPISRYAKDLMKAKGDETPISWLHREERFSEKLATPDVIVADLIGDIDPIKAANLKLSYADDRVIHWGMIPRANRGIFVINELPDLQARIQVALFNILQEGDIQIRGFKLRMPLDIQFVFTANPEDYTNRGSIVTPLKDRIGSQILTHYAQDLNIAKKITAQEAGLEGQLNSQIEVPELAKDLLEQISFSARESEYVDEKSGVSARLSITAFQNLISTAERRMLVTGEEKTSIRLSDFMGVIPSITGKIELVYEGELAGADYVAEKLIEDAVAQLFVNYFPKIEKLEKRGVQTAYDDIVQWFLESNSVEIYDDMGDKDFRAALDLAQPIKHLVEKFHPDLKEAEHYFMMEFLLWGLVNFNKIIKNRFINKITFEDLFAD